jgi:hypothetical protein
MTGKPEVREAVVDQQLAFLGIHVDQVAGTLMFYHVIRR